MDVSTLFAGKDFCTAFKPPYSLAEKINYTGRDFQYDGTPLRRHAVDMKTAQMFSAEFGNGNTENTLIVEHELHTDSKRKERLFGPPLQWGIMRLLIYPGEINAAEQGDFSQDVRMSANQSMSTAHYGFNIAFPNLGEFYEATHKLRDTKQTIRAIEALEKQLQYRVIDEYRVDETFTTINRLL